MKTKWKWKEMNSESPIYWEGIFFPPKNCSNISCVIFTCIKISVISNHSWHFHNHSFLGGLGLINTNLIKHDYFLTMGWKANLRNFSSSRSLDSFSKFNNHRQFIYSTIKHIMCEFEQTWKKVSYYRPDFFPRVFTTTHEVI